MSRAPWLALAATAIAVWANVGILGHYFFADDFANLVEVANYGPRDFIVAPAGGHMYLVRSSMLYLTFVAFGLNPVGYFAIALATHALNVCLLFGVARRLTGSAALALLGAVLFGIAPTNGGTLGWYAVYGHALALTFTLAAILLLVRGDERAPISGLQAAAVASCALAASQSFGTGAAVALVLPVIVVLLRPAVLRTPVALATICSVPALAPFAAWAMYAPTTRLNPNAAMTAALLIAFAGYWSQTTPVFLHLLTLGVVSLLLGAAYVPTAYPDAVSGLVVATFVAALITASIVGSWPERRRLMALGLLALASYAAIAAGRGTLIVSLRPNDFVQVLVQATRYHYMAQAGLALLLCMILAVAGHRWPALVRPGGAVLAAWLACALVSRLLWPPVVDDFKRSRERIATVQAQIENEIREQPAGSAACLTNRPLRVSLGFPGTVGLYMLAHRSDEFEGRRVYFTTADPRLLASRLAGSRAEALLVPEGACPPAGSRPGT